MAHVSGPALSDDTEIPWDQAMLDVLFEYPIASDRRRFSIRPALRAARPARRDGPAFHAAGWRGACVRIHRRSRARPARSAMASGRVALRPARLRPHPRRHGSPAVSPVPRHPVPPPPRARPHRHRLHRRRIPDAHRVGLEAWARTALWFPPLVETLIAASIVYMALENIVRQRPASADPSRSAWLSGAGSWRSDSAWCTASASRSRCASRCSLPARTC